MTGRKGLVTTDAITAMGPLAPAIVIIGLLAPTIMEQSITVNTF